MKVQLLNNISDELVMKMLHKEDGYAYHVTTAEAASDILASGSLEIYQPSYGTPDQNVWPDGSTELRSYWAAQPNNLAFAPEGDIVMLRTKADGHKREAGTSDLYLTGPIPATELEIYCDNGWQPLHVLEVEQLTLPLEDSGLSLPNDNINIEL